MSWKPYLIGLIALALVLAGVYAKGVYEEAAQADVLRQQIKAMAEKQDAQAAVSKRAETQLQADRQTIATLNKKWNALRASKDHTDCLLDAPTLSLLQVVTYGDLAPR